MTYANVQTNLVRNGLIEEIQLEGHLSITEELVSQLGPEAKFEVGHRQGMIHILIDEYILPASRAVVLQQQHVLQHSQSSANNGSGEPRPPHVEEINPICSSAATLQAAFDVLVALCTSCVENLEFVAQTLTEMFYLSDPSEQSSSLDWEYLPPVGPRPPRGFVGLKNAGATCYMNSVFQQVCKIDIFC